MEPEPREAKWDDGISTATTATKFSPPGSNLLSETPTSVNEPQIDKSGARRSESDSPLYYDDQFDGPIKTRAKGPRRDIPTGYTIDTLIDALLEIGDYEDYEDSDSLSVASLGMSSLFTFTDSEEEGNLEKAFDDKSTICGVGEEEDTTDYWEERRAWEDVKRQVMHVEEFGAQPLDGAGDAERASRELRARRRRNWAEEVVRGHAREEVKRRLSAKKRRRHAGCWVHEDGVFVRLVRIHPSSFSFFLHSWNLYSTRVFSQYARRT